MVFIAKQKFEASVWLGREEPTNLRESRDARNHLRLVAGFYKTLGLEMPCSTAIKHLSIGDYYKKSEIFVYVCKAYIPNCS